MNSKDHKALVDHINMYERQNPQMWGRLEMDDLKSASKKELIEEIIELEGAMAGLWKTKERYKARLKAADLFFVKPNKQ
jgi:hypothetical protein